MNQYSQTDCTSEKRRRLELLREKAKELISGTKLHPGEVVNKGQKESEVVIFFIDENPISELLKEIPNFSKKFVDWFDE